MMGDSTPREGLCDLGALLWGGFGDPFWLSRLCRGLKKLTLLAAGLSSSAVLVGVTAALAFPRRRAAIALIALTASIYTVSWASV